MKQLVIHPERCTACRMCELACSMEHEGVFDPSRSRIQVEIFLEDAFYLPMACYHCDDYPCGQVCPTEAIVKDLSTKWITVIDEKCIGCKMCMQACPFGVMGFATKYRCGAKLRFMRRGPRMCEILCSTGSGIPGH